MKIVSYNVNGIRAAINKGFIDWLKATDPDIICLQEVTKTFLNLLLDELWLQQNNYYVIIMKSIVNLFSLVIRPRQLQASILVLYQ